MYEFGNNKAERYTKKEMAKDEVREDGRLVGEKGGRKAYITEQWKRLLRMARNRCILHVPME